MSEMPMLWHGGANDEDAVLRCQTILKNHGFYHGKVDGDFGASTDRAVEQFQGSAGLDVDGWVGPNTWKALFALESGEVSVTPEDALQKEREGLRALIPTSTSDLQRKALEAALRYYGAREEPDGSNRGPVIDDLVATYNDYWKIPTTTGLAWCAMSCSSWIAFAYGLTKNPTWGSWEGHPFFNEGSGGGAYMGGVSQIEEWAKNNQRWTPAGMEGDWPPGALFTVPSTHSSTDAQASTQASHVGMVLCDNGDGTITTIEGNIANKVGTLTRSKAKQRGWVRWW